MCVSPRNSKPHVSAKSRGNRHRCTRRGCCCFGGRRWMDSEFMFCNYTDSSRRCVLRREHAFANYALLWYYWSLLESGKVVVYVCLKAGRVALHVLSKHARFSRIVLFHQVKTQINLQMILNFNEMSHPNFRTFSLIQMINQLVPVSTTWPETGFFWFIFGRTPPPAQGPAAPKPIIFILPRGEAVRPSRRWKLMKLINLKLDINVSSSIWRIVPARVTGCKFASRSHFWPNVQYE